MDGSATQSATTTTLTRQRAYLRAHGEFLRGSTGDDDVRYLQVWAVDVAEVVRWFVEGWGVWWVLKLGVGSAALGCTPTLLLNSIAKRDREANNKK